MYVDTRREIQCAPSLLSLILSFFFKRRQPDRKVAPSFFLFFPPAVCPFSYVVLLFESRGGGQRWGLEFRPEMYSARPSSAYKKLPGSSDTVQRFRFSRHFYSDAFKPSKCAAKPVHALIASFVQC